MNRRQFFFSTLGAAQFARQPLTAAEKGDPILEAMLAELQRSLRLSVAGEDPYFIEYSIEDGSNYNVIATLGGVVQAHRSTYRLPRIQVRVGSYDFDNTNTVYYGYGGGARYDSDHWPQEADKAKIRNDLWLATDRAYKSAVQAFSLKKAALRNVTQSDVLKDFAKSKPLVKIQSAANFNIDEKLWKERIRKLSTAFTAYPKVTDSRVELESGGATFYLANTEGTQVRMPEIFYSVRVRAVAMASDGTDLHDSIEFHGLHEKDLPSEETMLARIRAMAERLTKMTDAPVGEDYTGPMLFTNEAAAQLVAQMIGMQLAPSRAPISDPNRPATVVPTELEGRIGVRVLPDFVDIVDDPTTGSLNGVPLFGSYEVDLEGVEPAPLQVVEKGVFKSFVLTRTPVRGFEFSNGRARLPGNFGRNLGMFSNLIVKTSQPTPAATLKAKLIDLVKQRNKPYGILVERLDLPSTASITELRRIAGAQPGGKLNSSPIAISRVYPDGRQEPIRGVRFRSLNVRSMRDVLATGDDPYVWSTLANAAPLFLAGAGGFVNGVSVVSPSLLLEEVEVERPQEERPRPPVVPPPTMESSG